MYLNLNLNLTEEEELYIFSSAIARKYIKHSLNICFFIYVISKVSFKNKHCLGANLGIDK